MGAAHAGHPLAALVHEAALVAADCGPAAEGAGGCGGRAGSGLAPADRVPHGVLVEPGVGGGGDEHEGAQGVEAEADLDGREGGEPGVGDEEAEEEHLDHGPGAEAVAQPGHEDEGGAARMVAEAEQHAEGEDEAQERGDQRRGEHGDRQQRHVLVLEGHGQVQQARLGLLPREPEGEQREARGDDEKQQAGGRKGGDDLEAAAAAAAEHAAAAGACGDLARAERAHALHEAAIVAFAPGRAAGDRERADGHQGPERAGAGCVADRLGAA